MGTRNGIVTTFLGALLTPLVLAGPGSAAVLDLTTAGASGFVNGAFFQQVAPQPTGTGVIDSFLRLQANGLEQGYNTGARPVEFDQKTDPNFTRNLLLSDVPVVNLNGTAYRQFLLDINESSGQNREFLSLDKLQIFQSDTPNVNSYSNLGTKIYDLAPNSIYLDYSLNHGSGSGDMFAYIPDSLFDPTTPYVYLYSLFGNEMGADGTSDAGFEEWAVLQGQTPVNEIPAPATLIFAALGCGLGFVGYVAHNARGKLNPARVSA